jgi:valyl-tRNA synthetase
MTVNAIPKIYSPKKIECKWSEFWEKHQLYRAAVSSDKPRFSIVIPPPNVTGNLTIGHILNNTIQDIYARWKRMSGFNVLWLPGTDHAGIATQTVVERHLKAQKLTKYDLGRKKFVQKVWEWKDVYHKNIKNQLVRMGASVDWSRERFTMDEGLSHAVRKVFVDLYNKGLIYKGKRIINWDPVAQTALSDEEVEYRERRDNLYYIKYPIVGENSFITIATTRPETMLGDTAVAVHPDDKRYSDIIGKKVILPIVERVIPIIADAYVDREFGTGALKITPAHDPNDFELAQKYKLETIQVIDHQGKMNELAAKFSGLDRFEARRKIVERLNELGLLEKVEDYVHNVGYSERGGTMIEPYLSDQWFVSMKSLAEPALNAVLSGEIKFYPERWYRVYENWMNNIKDWCISRQLWWGHQIPVWYNKSTGEQYCGMQPPKDVENWEQDPDVLDTWFSSWLWPFSTMGWPEETEDLKVFFPTDLLSTGPDIIFFWVARMIMASLEFTGVIPFKVVYFHNIIRDDKGRKLSKSLGNSPDVFEVMDNYGTDALRFTLVYLAPQGVDVFFSVQKCEIGRNFANKIWNAARFLLLKRTQIPPSRGDRGVSDIFDAWIFSRLNSTIRDYSNALSNYKINEASKALHEFVWGDFCDWYVEVLKTKVNENPNQAAEILDEAFKIFEVILKMLHPIMPFLTEELWHLIEERKEGESISLADFPDADKSLISPETEKNIARVQDIVTAIRNLRSEMEVGPAIKCKVNISCQDDSSMELINSVSSYVMALAKLEDLTFSSQPGKAKYVSSVVDKYQVNLLVDGVIDIPKEQARLSKEIQRIESFAESIEKKLHNENFRCKAAPEVIANEEKKLEDSRLKLERLKSYYKTLM